MRLVDGQPRQPDLRQPVLQARRGETLRRYPPGLRELAVRRGAPERYHETVTWGLIVLIHERMASAPEPPAWIPPSMGSTLTRAGRRS